MKKFLIQTLLLIAVISLGLYFSLSSIGPINAPSNRQSTNYTTLTINGNVLKVEIADDNNERNKGLSGRESLPFDSGLLFVYEKLGNHTFWMKGMKFPLDFVWIRGDIVTEVTENIPPAAPGTADANLPLYSSKNSVDKILELNAGTVARLNIKAGDKITLQ